MDVEYDSQIIVKLLNKLDYTTVNVEINRIYHGYSFSLFKGNVDFSGKLIESEFDYIISSDDIDSLTKKLYFKEYL